MPKPTLDESFAQDLPSRRPDQQHSWLNAGERRFILWGLKERWPATRIAIQLGVNEATVRKFRQNYLRPGSGTGVGALRDGGEAR